MTDMEEQSEKKTVKLALRELQSDADFALMEAIELRDDLDATQERLAEARARVAELEVNAVELELQVKEKEKLAESLRTDHTEANVEFIKVYYKHVWVIIKTQNTSPIVTQQSSVECIGCPAVICTPNNTVESIHFPSCPQNAVWQENQRIEATQSRDAKLEATQSRGKFADFATSDIVGAFTSEKKARECMNRLGEGYRVLRMYTSLVGDVHLRHINNVVG